MVEKAITRDEVLKSLQLLAVLRDAVVVEEHGVHKIRTSMTGKDLDDLIRVGGRALEDYARKQPGSKTIANAIECLNTLRAAQAEGRPFLIEPLPGTRPLLPKEPDNGA